MFWIGKAFTFAAAHRLAGLPPEHQCSRMHGHNYRVEVILTAPELDEVGFVRDFGDLRPVKEWIAAEWDHRVLNEVIDQNPTAEHLARLVGLRTMELLRLPDDRVRLEFVRVFETETSWAEWTAL